MERMFGATEHADSAGTPWAGRSFTPNPNTQDDGSAPAELLETLLAFRAGQMGEADVISALRNSRVLVPLLAEAGEVGYTPDGKLVDKTQELSLVTVAAADGRAVLPAFTSVTSMAAWNKSARPVPVSGPRAALAAAEDGTDLIVLDPTSETEFVIRRPAIWALAENIPWVPCYLDERVLKAFMEGAAPEPDVHAVELIPGDPDARLAGPDLVVRLRISDGLDRETLAGLLARLQDRWAVDETIATAVDALAVRVVSAV